MSFKTVGIYGLGLLGASLGWSIRGRHPKTQIIGFARRSESIRAAKQKGMIHQGYVGFGALTDLSSIDLLVLCVPIRSIISALDVIRRHGHDRLVVIDVGSTKEDIVKAADKVFAGTGISFVGCHPMAGSDKSGLDFARSDLFKKSLCLITKGKTSKVRDISRVKMFWKEQGCRVRELSPSLHDRIIARVSHFPHLVSAALMDSIRDDFLPYAGNGFKDMTRIAGSDSGLWREILFSNVRAVKKAHTEFEKKLNRMIRLLDSKNEVPLTQSFHAASERRKALD